MVAVGSSKLRKQAAVGAGQLAFWLREGFLVCWLSDIIS